MPRPVKPKEDVFSAKELSEAERLCHPPRTRAECPHYITPCPHILCRYHLWIRANAVGDILESECWGDVKHTCVLNVVDEFPSGMTFEQVADVLHCSRQWAREIEAKVLPRLAKSEVLKRHLSEGGGHECRKGGQCCQEVQHV